jgi:hypothetical protein
MLQFGLQFSNRKAVHPPADYLPRGRDRSLERRRGMKGGMVARR